MRSSPAWSRTTAKSRRGRTSEPEPFDVALSHEAAAPDLAARKGQRRPEPARAGAAGPGGRPQGPPLDWLGASRFAAHGVAHRLVAKRRRRAALALPPLLLRAPLRERPLRRAPPRERRSRGG